MTVIVTISALVGVAADLFVWRLRGVLWHRPHYVVVVRGLETHVVLPLYSMTYHSLYEADRAARHLNLAQEQAGSTGVTVYEVRTLPFQDVP